MNLCNCEFVGGLVQVPLLAPHTCPTFPVETSAGPFYLPLLPTAEPQYQALNWTNPFQQEVSVTRVDA